MCTTCHNLRVFLFLVDLFNQNLLSFQTCVYTKSFSELHIFTSRWLKLNTMLIAFIELFFTKNSETWIKKTEIRKKWITRSWKQKPKKPEPEKKNTEKTKAKKGGRKHGCGFYIFFRSICCGFLFFSGKHMLYFWRKHYVSCTITDYAFPSQEAQVMLLAEGNLHFHEKHNYVFHRSTFFLKKPGCVSQKKMKNNSPKSMKIMENRKAKKNQSRIRKCVKKRA